METTPRQAFTIQRAQLDDVPVLAELSADAFLDDRQTQMKALGAEPYDLRAEMAGSLPGLLRSPRCVVVKAVDTVSGEVAGYCSWGFNGLEPHEVPVAQAEGHVGGPARVPAEGDRARLSNPSGRREAGADMRDPIKRLEDRTKADMNAWVAAVMAEGTRCLYVICLSVAPRHQGRGIGTALLRWGTRACDELRVFAWVQSSGPAWGMYEKCGFQTVRSLDVDLDEYAPAAPPNEGPGARWGHYVFRYMKYLPGGGCGGR